MCNRPGGRAAGKRIDSNLFTCGDQEMHVFTVNVIEGRFIVSCPDLSGASRRAILPFLRDSACVCTGARSSPIGISCPAAITDKSGYDMIMHINKIIWLAEHPARADKSALGPINRPLRLSGLFC